MNADCARFEVVSHGKNDITEDASERAHYGDPVNPLSSNLGVQSEFYTDLRLRLRSIKSLPVELQCQKVINSRGEECGISSIIECFDRCAKKTDKVSFCLVKDYMLMDFTLILFVSCKNLPHA